MSTPDRTRRILHVTQPTTGGTAAVVRQLVSRTPPGYSVTVAAPDTDGFGDWVREQGIEWIPIPLTRQPSVADLVNVLRLRRVVRSFDVVHLHSSKAGAVGRLAAALLPRRARPRIVLTPHAWSWYVGGRMAAAYRRFERWAQRFADCIVVVSQAELDDGFAVLGAGAPLTVVENGVDVEHYSPDGPASRRSSEPLVVSVGRLSRQKGQDRLIRALHALEGRPARLVFVGDGEDEAELRALGEELSLGERVEFVGPADPRPYLRAADVVVLPSRWEGMSLVLLEAMACGCAVITTQCGGSDALGDTGLLVPAEDDDACIAALGPALSTLLEDQPQRVALGAAARRRAVERYSIDAVVRRYEQIWRF